MATDLQVMLIALVIRAVGGGIPLSRPNTSNILLLSIMIKNPTKIPEARRCSGSPSISHHLFLIPLSTFFLISSNPSITLLAIAITNDRDNHMMNRQTHTTNNIASLVEVVI